MVGIIVENTLAAAQARFQAGLMLSWLINKHNMIFFYNVADVLCLPCILVLLDFIVASRWLTRGKKKNLQGTGRPRTFLALLVFFMQSFD